MRKQKLMLILLGLSLMTNPMTLYAADTSTEESQEVSQVVEKVALDSKPSDLNINLPSQITLGKLEDGSYGFEDVVSISCSSDSQYEVVIKLKSTDIVYRNENESVSGVVSLAGSDSYTWSADDIMNNVSVPLAVRVNESVVGSYNTSITFSIDIYQYISLEDAEEPEEEVSNLSENTEDIVSEEFTEEANVTENVDENISSEEVKEEISSIEGVVSEFSEDSAIVENEAPLEQIPSEQETEVAIEDTEEPEEEITSEQITEEVEGNSSSEETEGNSSSEETEGNSSSEEAEEEISSEETEGNSSSEEAEEEIPSEEASGVIDDEADEEIIEEVTEEISSNEGVVEN